MYFEEVSLVTIQNLIEDLSSLFSGTDDAFSLKVLVKCVGECDIFEEFDVDLDDDFADWKDASAKNNAVSRQRIKDNAGYSDLTRVFKGFYNIHYKCDDLYLMVSSQFSRANELFVTVEFIRQLKGFPVVLAYHACSAVHDNQRVLELDIYGVFTSGLENIAEKFGRVSPQPNSAPGMDKSFLVDDRLRPDIRAREYAEEYLPEEDDEWISAEDIESDPSYIQRQANEWSGAFLFNAFRNAVSFDETASILKKYLRLCVPLGISAPTVGGLLFTDSDTAIEGIGKILSAADAFVRSTGKWSPAHGQVVSQYLRRVASSEGTCTNGGYGPASDLIRFFSPNIVGIFKALWEFIDVAGTPEKTWNPASVYADALMGAAALGISLRDIKEHFRGAVATYQKAEMPIRYQRWNGEHIFLMPRQVKKALVTQPSEAPMPGWLTLAEMAHREFHIKDTPKMPDKEQALDAPEDWEFLGNMERLKEVCKEYNWCVSSNSYYLSKISKDEAEFYLLPEGTEEIEGIDGPVLAMYSIRKGECEEAKTPGNRFEVRHLLQDLDKLE